MHTSPRFAAALLALGGLLAARGAGAQPRAPLRAAGPLPLGAEVRVSRGGSRLEGRVLAGAGDTLAVAPGFGGPPFRTVLTARDTVWVATGRAWRRGAALGAGVGAVVLSGVAFAYARAECAPSSSCGTAYAVLVGATFGGGGGAALGATVGATVRRWRRVHP